MQITSILRRAAQVNQNGTATICKDRQQTWAQMQDRVARLAGALQSLGMKTGDRVALLSLNSDRFIEYYFASVWGGGVMMPMNVRWAPAASPIPRPSISRITPSICTRHRCSPRTPRWTPSPHIDPAMCCWCR